jgi:hypothetical protein
VKNNEEVSKECGCGPEVNAGRLSSNTTLVTSMDLKAGTNVSEEHTAFFFRAVFGVCNNGASAVLMSYKDVNFHTLN